MRLSALSSAPGSALYPLLLLASLLALLSCAGAPGDQASSQPIDAPSNVLLLTLDTTRADHIGSYGHPYIQTPNIDRLATEGVRYDSAFTVVPITLPSHLSMMSGRYPSWHGVRENGGFYVPQEMTTLAEILSAAGYDTAAFVGAFPLDSQSGLDQGFDLYDDNYPSRQDEHPRLRRFYDERPAKDVVLAANAWLDDRGQAPFFLWAHFFDPHQPFTPPSPHRERYPDSAYAAEIASVDEAIGSLLGKLDAIGELDNTLVVLTADHGEGLGEHGEATHALLLYSSTLRVPLIVRDPKGPSGETVTAPVATLDIFSTVLDRLDLPIPEGNQGAPLPIRQQDADLDRQIVSETLFGNVVYGWSPIYRLTTADEVHIHGPSLRLYDRNDDPRELDDLTEAKPEQADELLGELTARRSEAREGGFRFSRGAVSEETIARLAALGYVSAPRDQALSDEVDRLLPDPLSSMAVFDLQNEGHTLADNGQFDMAIPILERARALDENNPAVAINLMQSYLGIGDGPRALAAMERLIELSPNHTTTLVLQSRYLRSIGELERATEVLQTAVDVDPADLSTRMLLAHSLEDVGRPTRSETMYREILELDGDHVLAKNGLATLLYRRGDAEGAKTLLRSALEHQPFYAPASLNLAVIEYDDGHSDEARRLAERALALRPGYPQAIELLALTETKQK